MNPHVRLAFLFALALSSALSAIASDVSERAASEPSLQTEKSVAVGSEQASEPPVAASTSQGAEDASPAVSPDSMKSSASPGAADSSAFPETSEPVKSSAPSDASAPSNPPALEDDFQAIMRKIRAASPILYETMQTRPRAEILTALFHALNAGILAGAEEQPAAPAPDAVVPASVFELAEERVLCLRIDRLDSAALDLLKADGLFRSEKGAAGLIVDLRSCSGGDQRLWKDFSSALRATGRPLCLLTSDRTSGPAELLVPRLRKGCVWIGRPTRGEAFPFTAVSAACGTWRIPAVEPDEADFLSWKGAPDFEADPFPQAAPNQSDDEAALRKDACLSFARDILVAKSLLDRSRAEPSVR